MVEALGNREHGFQKAMSKSPPKTPEQLLDELGISEPEDLDIKAIAYQCGAIICCEPLSGCKTNLLGRGEKASYRKTVGQSRRGAVFPPVTNWASGWEIIVASPRVENSTLQTLEVIKHAFTQRLLRRTSHNAEHPIGPESARSVRSSHSIRPGRPKGSVPPGTSSLSSGSLTSWPSLEEAPEFWLRSAWEITH